MAEMQGRIDWHAIRDRVDLAAIAINLLGPADHRKGKRLLWCCPFHEDQHPSFQVDLQRQRWRCWTCAVGGDAADLVMRINGWNFAAAAEFLAGLLGGVPSSREEKSRKPNPPRERKVSDFPTPPSGLPADEADLLAQGAQERLWGASGQDALAYLQARGLDAETIRKASLGWVHNVQVPTRDGDRCFRYGGITIPWRDGDRLTRIKIRRWPETQRPPKYAEAFSDRPLIYPDLTAIRPGHPLIIAEGEFDALLLAQQLPEASVITLGSASMQIESAVLSRMLSAPRWYAALDADSAGDVAASKLPARAVRVRPPAPDKDWTDTHAKGPNRIRYWWGRHLGLSKSGLR
jgi:DNA primase